MLYFLVYVLLRLLLISQLHLIFSLLLMQRLQPQCSLNVALMQLMWPNVEDVIVSQYATAFTDFWKIINLQLPIKWLLLISDRLPDPSRSALADSLCSTAVAIAALSPMALLAGQRSVAVVSGIVVVIVVTAGSGVAGVGRLLGAPGGLIARWSGVCSAGYLFPRIHKVEKEINYLNFCITYIKKRSCIFSRQYSASLAPIRLRYHRRPEIRECMPAGLRCMFMINTSSRNRSLQFIQYVRSQR